MLCVSVGVRASAAAATPVALPTLRSIGVKLFVDN